jgi:hypothetical protein
MKRILIIPFLAMLLVAGLVSGTMAGYSYHGHGMKMGDMSRMDGNNDNQITFEEFSASHLDRLRSAFNMLDTDNDGFISQGEYNEFLKVHGYEVPSEG